MTPNEIALICVREQWSWDSVKDEAEGRDEWFIAHGGQDAALSITVKLLEAGEITNDDLDEAREWLRNRQNVRRPDDSD